MYRTTSLLSVFSMEKLEGEASDISGVVVGRSSAPHKRQPADNVVAQVIVWQQKAATINKARKKRYFIEFI